MLGLLAIFLQQLTPYCLAHPNTAPGHTIVLCTSAGMKTVIVDESGTPAGPQQPDHGAPCTFCVSGHNTVAFTASQPEPIEAAAHVLGTLSDDPHTSAPMFHWYASRAPPHLSA
jgi:hypothetical protein